MRTINEINKILRDENGRFKYSLLNRIAKESGEEYHRVANIMHQRKIALKDPQVRAKVYQAANQICDQEEKAMNEVKKYEQLSIDDVQLIFKSLKNPLGTNPNVSSNLDTGDIQVWYMGADEDLCIKIEYNDMKKHIKDYDLNQVQTGLDSTHTFSIEEFLEENLDEMSIHYIQHNNQFEIL